MRSACSAAIRMALLPIWLAMAAPAAAQMPPPAPDYSQVNAWAALPGMQSGAEALPQNITPPKKGPHPVDVFYIHPTTFFGIVAWNAAYDEGGLTGLMVDRGTLRFQASAFNGCCDIYAPQYRQAALRVFTHNTPRGRDALDLAYGDVRAAFDYYIAHYNHGRPFILVSHSQGSLHAMRLLQEEIVGSGRQRQLVAAYVVGASMPVSFTKTVLPACATATATGCMVQWNSVADTAGGQHWLTSALIWNAGQYQEIDGRPILCVNPLSWRIDATAPATRNAGAVPGTRPMQPMPATIPGLTGAACQDGLLDIAIPPDERHGFSDLLTRTGSYHVYDYNLFWMNIRENVAARVRAYLRE